MLAILAITCPIFALIGLGFACVRLGAFGRGDMPILGRFVINVALPALMVAALSRRSLAEILRLDYLAACACGALAIYGLVLALCLGPCRRGLGESAVMAMGAAVSNTAFMGFPILLQVAPQVASLTLALNLLVENVLVLPLALALAGLGGQSGRRGLGRQLSAVAGALVRKPLIVGIFLGLALSLCGVRPPEPALKALDLLGAVAAPVALFTLGGNLAGSRPGREENPARHELWLIVGAKLVLHPLLAGLIVCTLPTLAPEMRAAAIVFAAMPVFSIYPLLGAAYGMERFCSTAVVAATLLSFAGISVALGLVRLFVMPG